MRGRIQESGTRLTHCVKQGEDAFPVCHCLTRRVKQCCALDRVGHCLHLARRWRDTKRVPLLDAPRQAVLCSERHRALLVRPWYMHSVPAGLRAAAFKRVAHA